MTPLQIYALTTIILALKMTSISVVQGLGRTRAGVFVNPEDAKSFGGNQASDEVESVRRAARAWSNDLENIPIFLILGWIYVAAGLGTAAFLIYCIVFTLARIAHTICYLNSIQPFRTIAYTIGAIVTLGLMIELFVKVVI